MISIPIYFLFLIIIVTTAFLYLFGYKFIKKKMYLWFFSYLKWEVWNLFRKKVSPVHVMFLVADHYEPGPRTEIVREWIRRYPEIADKHRDADGLPPQHTWFYPCERAEGRFEQLEILSELVHSGYGEIELHLHHQNDTADTLREKLIKAKEIYSRIGALVTCDDKAVFGFVHGNWALDNSIILGSENFCGVNNEITVLKEEGCYADFTFPAVNTTAQPSKINSIYYAVDDPEKPKSHNTGIDVKVSKPPSGDLLIIQGPLSVNFRDWSSGFYPRIENGEVEGTSPPSLKRVDQWVRTNIHVKGKPDWVFVKIHTHGALPGSMDIFLDDTIDQIYTYLETKYNNGKNYSLHYVTAREAYNIIKAAEAGLSGNPNQYRDYLIKPYKNSALKIK